MQSAARKLKRISAGQQNDKARHNNRRRTPGRNLYYVKVLPTENFKVPVETVHTTKSGETVKRVLGKISRKRIEGLALLEKVKNRLKDTERLNDLKKVKAYMNAVRKLKILTKARFSWKLEIKEEVFEHARAAILKKRPTVECSILILKQLFKQKLIFRTSPVHAGLLSGHA